MKSLIPAAILVLASVEAASAIEGIEAADRDLWCGAAIEFVVAERPSDSAIDQATLDGLVDGARYLLERGAAAYLERGFSDTVLDRRRGELAQRAGSQLGTPEKDEPFSYEECRALFD